MLNRNLLWGVCAAVLGLACPEGLAQTPAQGGLPAGSLTQSPAAAPQRPVEPAPPGMAPLPAPLSAPAAAAPQGSPALPEPPPQLGVPPAALPGGPVPTPETTAETAVPPAEAAEEPAELSAIELRMGEAATPVETAAPQPFEPQRLLQFGYDFFRNVKDFPSVTDVPVPPEYPVGPGDRIVVNLWGSIEGVYDLTVSRSGEVAFPKVGTVRVGGVPFGSLREVLRNQIGRVFKDFELDVNLSELRVVKIFVVGEVAVPGGYSLEALSTVIGALAAAGGPTKNGSLRRVEVRRRGELVGSLDLYDFFLRGDNARDVHLLDGDTVFVPVIGKVAGIAGNVVRPAIYELGAEGSLGELVALAGGLVPTSELQRVQVARVEAHRREVVVDFNLGPGAAGEGFAARAAQVGIGDRDLVTILPIDRRLRESVKLDGYVLRPGQYALAPGMRVRDLLPADGLLPETYEETAELTRLHPPDQHPEVHLFSLRAALEGDPEHNRELQEFDKVRVFSRWDMEDLPEVTATGEVRRPGPYRLLQGMRVRDLVMAAGNVKATAYLSSAELKRYRKTAAAWEGYSVTVALERALQGDAAHNLLLSADDELVVAKAPVVPKTTHVVRVQGEVLRPGDYPLREGMTVRDLLREAGDPHPVRAYLRKAELNRIRIEDGSVTSLPIFLNLEEVLAAAPGADVPLQPYDELLVRRLPNWLEETDRYVTVRGEVRFPGMYPIYKGERLSSVLERAGGYTEKAFLPAARFTRASVRELQQERLDDVVGLTEADIAQKQAELTAVAASKEELEATRAALLGLEKRVKQMKEAKAEGRVVIRLEPLESFRGGAYDVELMGGDTLTIPQASNAVVVLGAVYSPTTVLVVPDQTVDGYLAEAGGPTQNAEEAEMYVIRSDGSIVNRQQYERGGWWSSNRFLTMELQSGDTLVVPQKIERIAWMREIKDITQILAQVALTAGVLIAAGL